jgi:cellulose synthase/poly-beta-1,6-N-acetylglucosamine synthase-like glycosyltransferase
MSVFETAIVTAYFATLILLSVYGCHRSWLLYLYRRHRGAAPRAAGRLEPLPRITVQLPVYNEMYVVERAIRAAAALDYPPDRLEIQVLDDSTDETSRLAAAAVAALRAEGRQARHLRRADRDGYKAGALARGLREAGGELVAIFDADFVPPPSFLRELVHHFADPRVGMVQARWEHLNRDYSLLTRLQSIFLDGHFVIEHAARHRSGRFFNFNGTAGIWRRACIEEAGGWHHDTLTEDLDLSYRAQLAGWKFVFVPDVVAPAELPATLDAFKTQQRRWAQGSIQTGLKVLPRLLRSRLPLATKIEALFHLTGNGAYLLMLLLAVLMVPAMRIRSDLGMWAMLAVDLPLFLLSTLSISTFYLVSQKAAGRDWRSAVPLLPLLMSLGVGLSVNNARAVLLACRRGHDPFERTPKFRLEGRSGTWRGKSYHGLRQPAALALEGALALHFLFASFEAARDGEYLSLPFLLLFLSGFLYVALLSLGQAVGLRERIALTAAPARRR